MRNQHLLPLCLLFIFLYSCKEAEVRTEKKEVKIKKNNSLVIGNPLDYGLQDFLIFPVGSDYYAQVFEKPVPNTVSVSMSFACNVGTFNDRTANVEYINNAVDQFDIRNILFYSQITRKTYPLVTDTIHILSFALHKDFSNPLIFYRVVKKDFNNDSLYNDSDAVILFASDLYGKHLVQMTPDNEKFLDYFYYQKTQTILVKTAIDADKDKRFTFGDETNFREVGLKEPAMGREIFAKSLKDSLRLK